MKRAMRRTIVEQIEQSIEVLAPNPPSARVTIETGLPSGYWRALNNAVPGGPAQPDTLDDMQRRLRALCAVRHEPKRTEDR